MRLKLKLQEFDFTIVYKKGKENCNSDTLSRMFADKDPERANVNALTEKVSSGTSGGKAGVTEKKHGGSDKLGEFAQN
jgi:hypothetical protein